MICKSMISLTVAMPMTTREGKGAHWREGIGGNTTLMICKIPGSQNDRAKEPRINARTKRTDTR